jgi:glutathione S-transferase
MRALDIPFEEHLVVFEEGSNREKFRGFSPNGCVPCLHDGDSVIWDSLAIVEYLAERHAGVWPDRPDARAWARCIASEMHSGFPALRQDCSMTCGLRVKLNHTGAALAADIARVDEIWTESIMRFGGPWLTGADFNAADAFYAPIVFRAQTYGLELSRMAQAYADLVCSLPQMQAWYEAALAEPWREASHEEEVAARGTVIADYRKQ